MYYFKLLFYFCIILVLIYLCIYLFMLRPPLSSLGQNLTVSQKTEDDQDTRSRWKRLRVSGKRRRGPSLGPENRATVLYHERHHGRGYSVQLSWAEPDNIPGHTYDIQVSWPAMGIFSHDVIYHAYLAW